MESQQIQNIFLDYNKLFKPIKKGINIKLESQTTIFPTKLEYPILYYLIERIEHNLFLNKLQTSEEIELYTNFFDNYKDFSKSDFCKFMDIYGYKLTNYINYNNRIMSRINSLSGYSEDERQLYTKFIGCELQLEFETKRFTKQIYLVSYQDKKVKLIIYYKDKPNKNKINQLCSLIMFMKLYSKSSMVVDVTLFFIDKNKKLPIGKDKIIGPNSVNSGYSESVSNSYSKVCVFRIEEMEKVLVHEMIHALDLDLGIITTPSNLFTTFNINPNTEIILNESYTEILALVIIVALKSNNYEKMVQNLNRELKHTIKQVAKILKYNGFKTITEFVKPYDNLNKYKQNTPIFSYYFVKGGLLFNLSEFLWLVFIKRIEITPKLLLDFSNNDNYLDMIETQINKKDDSKSMKMTVIG
jgi:hypothetical protein